MYPVKLRAWDSKHEEMHHDGFYITASAKVMVGHLGVDWKLMQFTSFQDATGIEIYDGDILEYFGIRRIVGWNKETGQWCLKRHLDQHAKYHQQLATVELKKSNCIGNIFQNSDLMKGQR